MTQQHAIVGYLQGQVGPVTPEETCGLVTRRDHLVLVVGQHGVGS